MKGLDEIYQKAEKILVLFIEEALIRFNNRVISIFKIGSLGKHGDFSSCSDVDVALFLDEISLQDAKVIQEIIDKFSASQIEYADRLSIFWSCYDQDTFSSGKGRFPALDRLDLIDNGTLIYGQDRRTNLQKPCYAYILIESAKFISINMLAGDKFKIFTEEPKKIIEKGARYFSKAVLFPVRLVYSIEQADKIGSNYDAVQYFNEQLNINLKDSLVLVNKAYEARKLPSLSPPTGVSVSMLKIGLCPLYLFCIKQYIITLDKINSVDSKPTLEQLMFEYDRLSVAYKKMEKADNASQSILYA